MQKLTFIFAILLSFNCFAGGVYDFKVNGEALFKKFVDQGVPRPAVRRIFDYINSNQGKAVKVKSKDKDGKIVIKEIQVRQEVAAVIDYSIPSDKRRLYVMHFKTGIVSKHHIAHGKGSGVRFATKFSNVDMSKMTSLGLYVTGSKYIGGHGASLKLHGVDKTNDNAAARDIVMHGAKYVSEDFVKRTGRLGRSWGCPAVSESLMKKMIGYLQDGGLVYAYHQDIVEMMAKGKNVLVDTKVADDADQDLDGEEETERAKAKTTPKTPVKAVVKKQPSRNK